MPLGNMFRVQVEIGSIYEIPRETAETTNRVDQVFWSQRHFTIRPVGRVLSEDEIQTSLVKRFVTKQFFSRLAAAGYKTRRERSEFGDLTTTVFKEDDLVNRQHLDVVRLYRGFDARTLLVGGTTYLCIDPHVVVKSVASISHLLSRGLSWNDLAGLPVSFYEGDYARSGCFVSVTDVASGQVLDVTTAQHRALPLNRMFPANRPEVLRTVLALLGSSYDVVREVRRASFFYRRDAPLHRLRRTRDIARELATRVFPLEFGDFTARLATEPDEVILDRVEEW